MRLPRLKRLMAMPHWTRMEMNGAGGHSITVERTHEWYFESADRVIGVILGPRQVIEVDVAQIVSVRLVEPDSFAGPEH